MTQRKPSLGGVAIFLTAGLLVLLAATSALAQAKPSAELTKARDEYKAVTAKAKEALLNKYAKKEWDEAKARVAQAEEKAKAGDDKAAVSLYQQAAKAAKEAIDLAEYAEAAKTAAAAADVAKAKENLKRATPIIAEFEKEKDRFAALDLLLQLEDLIAADPRMPGFRQRVKAMPVPKETILQVSSRNHPKVPMKLVLIPAGTFTMGAPENETGRSADEGPQREVTISKPFYMGVCEVTQAQWDAGTRDRPSGKDPAYPAVDMSRDEILNFCQITSDSKAKRTVRLPTEAEWEYACRAGGKARFCFGDSESSLGDYAWNVANSDGKMQYGGKKKPNAFGLYDMHGNVWEWVADNYVEGYPAGKAVDPKGPDASPSQLARGGSWRSAPQLQRSAYRYIVPRSFHCDDLGFRVVVTWDLE